MKIYSSTTLNLYNKNCPHALTLDEADNPYDRELFQPGIAAHAVLQVAAEKPPADEAQLRTLADATVETLLREGRSFNGKHEPPMAPDAALEGRELGINWHLFNGMPDGPLYAEKGMGFAKNGDAVFYESEFVRYRGIMDLIYSDIDGDDECQFNVLVVRDYKSAWPAGENELDTIQRKGQAVLVFKHFNRDDKYQAIRLEVCNLRTGMTHTRTIMLDWEGIALLEQWEKDILMLCNVADTAREARVGSNCLGCRYVADCEPCRKARFTTTPTNIAVALAATQAVRDDLFAQAKLAITEGSIKAGGGTVGYKAQTRRKLSDNGHEVIADAWLAAQGQGAEDPDPLTLSLIKALAPGSTNVEKLAKVLYQGRGSKPDREAFAEDCLTEFNIAQFGIWK